MIDYKGGLEGEGDKSDIENVIRRTVFTTITSNLAGQFRHLDPYTLIGFSSSHTWSLTKKEGWEECWDGSVG